VGVISQRRLGFVLVGACCALVLAGSAGARGDHSAAYVQNSSPVWSPDGSKIAYLSSTEGLPPSLYVMNANGSGKVRLSQIESYSPAWSPDGQSIAFLGRDPIPSIYVVSADGTTDALTVDGAGAAVLAPLWSPDGSELLFAKLDVQGSSSLYSIPATGGTPTPLAKNSTRDAVAAWSPDGNSIAYTSCGACKGFRFANALYVSGADGKAARKLTSGGSVTSIAWSPDGKTIAYVTQGLGGGISLVGSNGKNTRSLAPAAGADAGPIWMPNGRSIVYEHASGPVTMIEGDAQFTENSKSDVWIMNSAGHDRRALTKDGESGGAVVSPDGHKIAFTVTDGENVEIDVMNANGTDKHKLA
jgi:TolB protein